MGNVLIDEPALNSTINEINVGSNTLTVGGSLTVNGATTGRKGILNIGTGSVDVESNLTLDANANAEVNF